MPQMLMDHGGIDPAADILAKLGDALEGVEILHNQVMIAVYVRPNKTASGIILSDQTRDEDRYQGKVGLLVKTGPRAFEADDRWFTGAEDFKVGKDWLVFRPSDTWSITIGNSKEKILCRIMDDINVRGRVPSPDIVW